MRTVTKIVSVVLFFPFLLNAQSIDTTKKGVIHIKKPAPGTARKGDRKMYIDSYGFWATEPSRVARFPLRDEGFANYLLKNMKYPEAAKEKKIEGKVEVSFIIDETGSVQEPKVIKGLSFGCDEEALRLIKEMPRWNPAYNNKEQPVASKINLSIPFKLK